jgi:aryl-alcohol dehydrogenase-like predicted oxidoreductase
LEYRFLGKSGLQVSEVGLGANPFGNEVDAATAAAIVHRAIDLGVTYIDTADIYNNGVSEEYVGRALRGHRHQVTLGSKGTGAMGSGPNDHGASRLHLMAALEASLRRLGTDYVDLYQMHHPDPGTPIEETARALDDMVRSGKVRYIGVSNYTDDQLVEAIWTIRAHGLTPLVSLQPQYSLLERSCETTLLPLCERHGLGIIPYFPLAGGFLTGTYRRGELPPAGSRGANRPTFARWTNDRNWDLLEKLEEFAASRGHTVSELAVAWLLSRPILATVIPGADTIEHIEGNVSAAEWRLPPEDMAAVDAITA